MIELQRVEVVWKDAFHVEETENPLGEEIPTFNILGYLLGEDDDVLRIAGAYTEKDSRVVYREVLLIPKRNIIVRQVSLHEQEIPRRNG